MTSWIAGCFAFYSSVAFFCFLCLFKPIFLSFASQFFVGALLFFFLSFSGVALINFTNFMDGVDGLVAGSMAICFSLLALQLPGSLPLWALVGSLLAFLLWNWSPAKVFMGDVGSTFLGAVFVSLVLQVPSWLNALSMLLVLTPLFCDTTLCLFRRLLSRQNLSKLMFTSLSAPSSWLVTF